MNNEFQQFNDLLKTYCPKDSVDLGANVGFGLTYIDGNALRQVVLLGKSIDFIDHIFNQLPKDAKVLIFEGSAITRMQCTDENGRVQPMNGFCIMFLSGEWEPVGSYQAIPELNLKPYYFSNSQ